MCSDKRQKVWKKYWNFIEKPKETFSKHYKDELLKTMSEMSEWLKTYAVAQ